MTRVLTQVVFLHPCYRVNILLFVGLCQKLLLMNEVEWVALCSRIDIGGARVCWLWAIRIKYTLSIYSEFHISLSLAAFQQENGLLAHLTVRLCSSCVIFLWHAVVTVLSWLPVTVVSRGTTHLVVKRSDAMEWHSRTGLSKKYRLHILDMFFTCCSQGWKSASWHKFSLTAELAFPDAHLAVDSVRYIAGSTVFDYLSTNWDYKEMSKYLIIITIFSSAVLLVSCGDFWKQQI